MFVMISKELTEHHLWHGQGSELDITDFELQAKTGDKFVCLTLFVNFTELYISLQSDVWLWWGLDHNEGF